MRSFENKNYAEFRKQELCRLSKTDTSEKCRKQIRILVRKQTRIIIRIIFRTCFRTSIRACFRIKAHKQARKLPYYFSCFLELFSSIVSSFEKNVTFSNVFERSKLNENNISEIVQKNSIQKGFVPFGNISICDIQKHLEAANPSTNIAKKRA